jgi:NADH:ubiquinone oxidoreductase subunit 3 (subunit A)
MAFLFLLAIILMVPALIIWKLNPASKALQWLGLIIAILFLIVFLNAIGYHERPLSSP